VTVTNADGSVRFSVVVFGGFTGGVTTAVADVTGSGVKEIVAAPGPGGGPQIAVLDSQTGALLNSMMVFEDTFRGGLNMSVLAPPGVGHLRVVVGAGNSGGPRVSELDLATDTVVLNFFAGDPSTRGGVSVAAAEFVPGRGVWLAVGGGPGSGPTVSVFDASSGASVGTFLAGDANDRAGIRVQAGQPNATTQVRPILVAPFLAPAGTGEQSFDPTQVLNIGAV
jgi:hypothetical protein